MVSWKASNLHSKNLESVESPGFVQCAKTRGKPGMSSQYLAGSLSRN